MQKPVKNKEMHIICWVRIHKVNISKGTRLKKKISKERKRNRVVSEMEIIVASSNITTGLNPFIRVKEASEAASVSSRGE